MPAPKNSSIPQTGSQSANFHEGTRSEYLSHYVFSSFGTCMPVSHSEDTGIDLHCTLTETVGQRIWPLAYYFVQVKSTQDPWVFSSVRSVSQFLKMPLPVFLCIVTKKELRLRVYGTHNRFSILKEIPDKLYLYPGDVSTEGKHWQNKTNWINLGAPILDFTLNDIVDESYALKAKQILQRCIAEEHTHLLLRSIGVPVFETSAHTTNEVERSGRRGRSHLKQSPDQKRRFDYALGRMLSWLQHSMLMGDARGHWRIQLFKHHLNTEGAAGTLKERGPLYETMLEYLRAQRKADISASSAWPSPTETLDTILDDVIHALIDEHLEQKQRMHEMRSSDDADEWDDDDKEE